MDDLYQTLGVSKDSSSDEIKKAYRNLAFKYHPDRNQGDKNAEELFKKINEAYSVLGDQTKRRQYDEYGTTDSSSSKTQYQNAYQNQYSYYSNDPFREWMNGSDEDSTNSTYYWTNRRPRETNYTKSQAWGLLFSKALLAALGFLSFRFSYIFFPVGPILSFIALINGVKGVFQAFSILAKPESK